MALTDLVIRVREALSVSEEFDGRIEAGIIAAGRRMLRDYNFPKQVLKLVYANVGAGAQEFIVPAGFKKIVGLRLHQLENGIDLWSEPLAKDDNFKLPRHFDVPYSYWQVGNNIRLSSAIPEDEVDVVLWYQSQRWEDCQSWLLSDYEDALYYFALVRLSADFRKKEVAELYGPFWADERTSLAIYLNELEWDDVIVLMREAKGFSSCYTDWKETSVEGGSAASLFLKIAAILALIGVGEYADNMGEFSSPLYTDNLKLKQTLESLPQNLLDPAKGAGQIAFNQLGSFGAGTLGRFLANNVLNAGAVLGEGTSLETRIANKTALEQLLIEAAARGMSVKIPENISGWYIAPGIESPLVSLIIEGRVYTNTTSSFIKMTATGPANSLSKPFSLTGGGRVYNENGTQNQRNSCVIDFYSTDVYILYPRFENLDTYGFYYSFVNSCPTFGSIFGRENRMNHIQSAGIVPHYYGALNAKGAFLLKKGSGTGAMFLSCTDDLAVGSAPEYRDPVDNETLGYPAYVCVKTGGEVNVVCGDFTIEGDFAGLNTGMLSVEGVNMVYKTKIKLLGQVDAQARRTMFEDPPGNDAFRSGKIDVLTGGDIDILKDGPYMAGSIVDAQGFASWRNGFGQQDLISGVKAVEVLRVQPRLRSSNKVEIFASGNVAGVDAGAYNVVFSVRHTGGAVIATQKSLWTDPASAPSGFFNITTSVEGDGTCVFTLNFTPTAAGSHFEVANEVTGGIAKVKRGGAL